jgi:peptidoglycan lytic transglycosylase F
LNKGFGDVIVAAFAITLERSKQIAFSRPFRFDDQVIVVRASDTSIQGIEDLSNQEVTVRPSSSYAEALRGLKEKGIKIKSAPENLDTFDLLQKGGAAGRRTSPSLTQIFSRRP